MRTVALLVVGFVLSTVTNAQEPKQLSVELAGRDSLSLGQIQLFRGTVRNNADEAINEIHVVMDADPQLHPISSSVDFRDPNSFSKTVWSIASLNPGESKVFEAQMRAVSTTEASQVRFVVSCDDHGLISDSVKFNVQPKEGVNLEPGVSLFDGTKPVGFLSKHGTEINWPIKDGALVSTAGENRSNHIVSAWHFRDADIHAEFLLPKTGSGNSGLYIHGNYELQIIDSHGKDDLGESDAGGIYGFAKPLVHAAKPRDQWQVYDVRYLAPRRDADGKITEQGSITAWLNGKLVQDNVRFGEAKSKFHPFKYKTTDYLKTIWENQKKTSVGPLFLQDHDNAVRFRNIWIRPLDELSTKYDPNK